jgi:gamma-glutamyltranspeptidase / glutathione hydrolase
MSPVIVEDERGARHAIGSPGGSKIPSIVMQLIVDAIHYRVPLAEAIALPRVSVAPDGRIEAEPAMLEVITQVLQARTIERSEYYSPASALSLDNEGSAHAALDPRFSPGVA